MTTVPIDSVTTPLGRVSYSESGHGRPLALFHSLLTDRSAFDPIVPALSGRVLGFDLPGFGLTVTAGRSISAWADLMAAGIAAVCDSDDPPAVMGNGLGSFVALALAIRHPELVRRLVLIGCGATFPEHAKPAFAKMIRLVENGGMEAVTAVALRRIYTEEFLEGHPEEASERARVLGTTDTDAFVDACRALQLVDLSNGVGGVGAPVLIVVGEQDQATPPGMARHLHGLIPDSRLVVLPGVAHAPHLQDPAGFAMTVAPFLEDE